MPIRYDWSDLPAILRNPRRGSIIGVGATQACWPVLRSLAGFARRTWLRKARIVGVTGSFGKTTTVRLIDAALGAQSFRDGRNHKAGVALSMLSFSGSTRAAIELGIDGPGQMEQYSRMVRPDIAVVSAVGSEHRSSLGTIEAIRDEKGRLVRGLIPGATAILNGDDPMVRQMAGWTQERVVLCGSGEDCDVRVLDSSVVWPKGLRLSIAAFGRTFPIQTRLLGAHMAFPVMAALTAAHEEGVPLEDAVRRLENAPPVPRRLQMVPLENGAIIVDDGFKSSYETVLAAFQAVEPLPAQRKLLVIGDVSEPPGKQGPLCREVGVHIGRLFDKVYCIGRHYKRYWPGAKEAGMQRDQLVRMTLDEVVASLRAELREGDLLLVKGRDTQRLERVTLGLQGRTVGCDLLYCDLRPQRCDECALLERGWGGLPRFMRAD